MATQKKLWGQFQNQSSPKCCEQLVLSTQQGNLSSESNNAHLEIVCLLTPVYKNKNKHEEPSLALKTSYV